MSSGGFITVNYQANTGILHPIRVQPETILLDIGGGVNVVPSEPAGVVKSNISSRVSGGRRGLGLFARMVRIQFGNADGDQPTGYQVRGIITLPILTQALYDAITRSDTGTYLTKTIKVVGLVPEVVR